VFACLDRQADLPRVQYIVLMFLSVFNDFNIFMRPFISLWADLYEIFRIGGHIGGDDQFDILFCGCSRDFAISTKAGWGLCQGRRQVQQSRMDNIGGTWRRASPPSRG